MKTKKIMSALLCGLLTIGLTGCGDEVQVSVSDSFDQPLQANGYSFTKKQVYQISSTTSDEVKTLKREADKFTQQFRYSNDIKSINDIKNIDTSFITDDNLKQSAEKAKTQLEASYKDADAKWQQQVEVVNKKYEAIFAEIQLEIDEAKKRNNQFVAFYKDELQKKEDAEKQLDALNKAKDEIMSEYTKLVQKDILDLKLPVRLRKSYSLVYHPGLGFKSTACRVIGGIEPIKHGNNCYYLQPPAKGLYEAPSYIQGKVLLVKYLDNRDYVKAVKKTISNQKTAIYNQKIVAENQIGEKEEVSERKIYFAESQLKSQQSSKERAIGEYEEVRFKQNLLRTDISNIADDIDSVTDSVAMNKLKEAYHAESTDIDDELAVDISLDPSLVVVEYKNQAGKIVSFVMQFNAKTVVEKDRPIEFVQSRHIKIINEPLTPESKRLARLFF